jgi:hypothetical protein
MAVSTVNSAAPTAAPVVDTTGSQAAGVAADPAAQQSGGMSSSMSATDLAALQGQISQNNMQMYINNLRAQQEETTNATAYNAMSSSISNTGKVMAKTISETNKMIDKATG